MKKLIHILLKYTWIIREYKDGTGIKQHKFNLWNPLAYIALLLTAVVAGVAEGAAISWKIVGETVKDALSKPGKTPTKPRN